MIFTETNLKGAYIIELSLRKDDRGFFARTFCANEFKEKGLKYNMVQSNLSKSIHKNTIRGMHFQIDEAKEAKLIRCIRGSITDIIIDIRPESSTYCQHIKVELTEDNYKMIYVPEGFAHGYVTNEDNSEIFYQVSNFYMPGSERGIRWNDKLFNIDWNVSNPIISEKDNSHPDFLKNNL